MNKIVAAGIVTGALALGLSGTAWADGKETFEKVCKMCHGAGVGGAPKFGDKKLWAPRIAKGLPVLEEHALKGFKDKGVMPPKGGRPSLSDDDVKAAVAYMVEAGKE
jgi:S-disulfanyl-L-cysteine oxidoreductase SoxD